MATINPHAIHAAFLHPVRRRALAVLYHYSADGLTPQDIADTLLEPLSNVSYHVRVLADCGAIDLVDRKQVRGSVEHFYALGEAVLGTPWAIDEIRAEPKPPPPLPRDRAPLSEETFERFSARLSREERKIVAMHYGFGRYAKTGRRKIGLAIGRTDAWVKQRERHAVAKLEAARVRAKEEAAPSE